MGIMSAKGKSLGASVPQDEQLPPTYTSRYVRIITVKTHTIGYRKLPFLRHLTYNGRIMTDTYSVSYVTTYLRDLLESDPFLSQLSVRGEVSNWTQARSGHCYFTLKDNQAELRCVMWRTIAQQLSILPQNGDEVIAEGRISIYPQRGAYQFYVNMMQPIGLGVLYKRFEALKEKLATEGLFEEWHKKPLPSFPRRIGIVTSPTAAALQDILNILKRRQPLAKVILSPTLVQGSRAPAQIVRALKRFDASKSAVDVIILARGGGLD